MTSKKKNAIGFRKEQASKAKPVKNKKVKLTKLDPKRIELRKYAWDSARSCHYVDDEPINAQRVLADAKSIENYLLTGAVPSDSDNTRAFEQSIVKFEHNALAENASRLSSFFSKEAKVPASAKGETFLESEVAMRAALDTTTGKEAKAKSSEK